jgi:thiol-disulfide isomerase/thioredoxin
LKRRQLLALIAAAPLLPAISACSPNAADDLVGSSLPELVLPDLWRAYDQFRDFGKAMLINVWATWCQPCRAEMAGLDRLYRSLSPQGLQLLGVSVDEDMNLVREYVRQAGVSFPVLSDPKGKNKNHYWNICRSSFSAGGAGRPCSESLWESGAGTTVRRGPGFRAVG